MNNFIIKKDHIQHLVAFHDDQQMIAAVTGERITIWNTNFSRREAVLKLLKQWPFYFGNQQDIKIHYYDQILLSITSEGYVEFGPIYNQDDVDGKLFWKDFEDFHPDRYGRNRPYFMG